MPKDPMEQVIGQDEAVRIARMCAKQRRNLLLVGPPGTGKSMIGQAMASVMPKPTQEIAVLHNPERPERPIVEVRTKDELLADKGIVGVKGKLINASEAPVFVAERLGYRCRRCGSFSKASLEVCPDCGADKFHKKDTLFDDLLDVDDFPDLDDRVHTVRKNEHGKDETVVFERADENKIRMLNEKEMAKIKTIENKSPRKVIVPIVRSLFVQATGASETELLGDVKHDPYGGHPEVGVLPYQRVVPGAVHEAHEGVLFVDELSTLGHLQRFLLTALQDKRFPITGRNASSTGASVRVDNVPCDFTLIAASNINNVSEILAPLRSRILGNGYEVLMATHMEDTEANRARLLRFIAQEIRKDGRIPHADMEAAELIINEAKRMAAQVDNAGGLTLRLRGLAGIIKFAGDVASSEEAKLITAENVKLAIKKSKSIEEQIGERYDSAWKAGMSDMGAKASTKRENEVR